MSASPVRNLPRVSVVGIGNILLGDDAFGPLAVEMFRCAYECGPEVETLDLGTPGFDLAPYLYDKDLVVIADAVIASPLHGEDKPGTLCIFSEGDFASPRAQLRLTSHDPGVHEALAQLRLAGHAPSEVIIVGVVPESCALGSSISACVMATAMIAVDAIANLLGERAIACHRRPVSVQPSLWWLSSNRATDDRSEFAALSL